MKNVGMKKILFCVERLIKRDRFFSVLKNVANVMDLTRFSTKKRRDH